MFQISVLQQRVAFNFSIQFTKMFCKSNFCRPPCLTFIRCFPAQLFTIDTNNRVPNTHGWAGYSKEWLFAKLSKVCGITNWASCTTTILCWERISFCNHAFKFDPPLLYNLYFDLWILWKALNLSTGQESKFWKIETRRRIQRFIGGKQEDKTLTLFYLSPLPLVEFWLKRWEKGNLNYQQILKWK